MKQAIRSKYSREQSNETNRKRLAFEFGIKADNIDTAGQNNGPETRYDLNIP